LCIDIFVSGYVSSVDFLGRNFEWVFFKVDGCADAFDAAPDIDCDIVSLEADGPSVWDFG
jgi:hypothetical protein